MHGHITTPEFPFSFCLNKQMHTQPENDNLDIFQRHLIFAFGHYFPFLHVW